MSAVRTPDALHRASVETAMTLEAGLRVAFAACFGEVVLSWHRGECRVVQDGVVLARVLARERGGIHLEFADATPREDELRAAVTALVEGSSPVEWGTLAGALPWSLPFDRGPGLYPVRELDLGAVTHHVVDPDRTWIAYLETSCLGDCIFCGRVQSQSDGVPESLALAAVRDGRTNLRDAYVCIGGPEPTLWPRLDEVVRVFADAGASTVAMIATGDMLADVNAARRLARAGLGSVSLPIYSASAESHEQIVRQPGAFERLRSAIDGARGAGLDVFLHTLVLDQNKAELGELFAWARQEGLPLVAGLPRGKHGAGIPFFPSAEDVQALAAQLPVVGLPLCLSQAKPAENLLRAFGPFVIYAHVQAGRFDPACSSCSARDGCTGLPSGLIDTWASSLRPARGGT